MIMLGIETSCDETGVALVKNGRSIIVNTVLSQELLHKPFGGVVPELASRYHLSHINRLVDETFNKSRITWNDISAIAVTMGPGLMGSLLVGVMTARGFAYVYKKKLIGIHHLESHLCASQLGANPPKPPFIALIVSGGHTNLIVVQEWGTYLVIGRTLDDAAGEAFDKVAKYVGLGYPGGPVIDRIGQSFKERAVSFPLPYPQTFNFSFSGIKTAVINYWNKARYTSSVEAVVTGFQKVVVDVLVRKTIRAAHAYRIPAVVIGGGVAANSLLREQCAVECKKNHLSFYLPSPELCTDNGAMVAAAGYIHITKKNVPHQFNVQSNVLLENWS